jgi:hypothetical protein
MADGRGRQGQGSVGTQGLLVRPQDIDTRAIRGVVGIMYAGRSGSFLLSNLFDSHPQILSCPPHSIRTAPWELHNYVAVAQRQSSGDDQFWAGLIGLFPRLFLGADHSDILGVTESPPKLGVNREAYGPVLERILTRTIEKYGALRISDIFVAIHLAYAEALGRVLQTDRPYIIWQRHAPIKHAKEAQMVGSTLPNPSLITAIRSPYKALDSALAHALVVKAVGDTAGTVNDVLISFGKSVLRKDVACPQYVVRFEDMHRHTEKTMRALCDIYGIDFLPSLLETTLDGGEYRFPTNGRFVTGVNPALIDDDGNYSVLTVRDIEALEPFLGPFCEKYGYRSKPLPSITTRHRSEPLLGDLPDEVLQYLQRVQQAGADDLPALIAPF